VPLPGKVSDPALITAVNPCRREATGWACDGWLGGMCNERDPVIIDRHVFNEQASWQEGLWNSVQGQTS
jgi:hypothetical protein